MVDCRNTGIGSTRLKRSFDVAFLTGIDVNVKSDVLTGVDVNTNVDIGINADVKNDVLTGIEDVDVKADVRTGNDVEVKANVDGEEDDIVDANLNLKNGRDEGKDMLPSISEEGVSHIYLVFLSTFVQVQE